MPEKNVGLYKIYLPNGVHSAATVRLLDEKTKLVGTLKWERHTNSHRSEAHPIFIENGKNYTATSVLVGREHSVNVSDFTDPLILK